MYSFFAFVLLFLFRFSIENEEALQKAVILNKGPCFIDQECLLIVNLPSIDPDLELTVDFGDGSDLVQMGNQSFVLNTFQNITGYGCILRHRFDTGGEYLVKATVKTELEPGVRYIAALLTTVRIKCSAPGLQVTRLSPEKPEQMARNETLVFHVKLIQNCTTRPVIIEWSLFVGPLNTNESVSSKDQKQAAEAEIKILPYTLHPGLHHLKVTGNVPYHNPQKYIQVGNLVSFEIVSLMSQADVTGSAVSDFEETIRFDASKPIDPNVDSSSGSYTVAVSIQSGIGPGLHIEDLPPDIDVICLTNCMEYVEHTKALVLSAHCHNCRPQEDVAYEWEFWPASINCTLQTIDWEADVLGGNRKSRLIIPKRTFENIAGDEGYQFIATVTRPGGKLSKAGYSCYFARYSGFIIPQAVEGKSACKQYSNQLLLLVSALFCLFLNLIE